MFARLLRDAYDPYESRQSIDPRVILGLLDDSYERPHLHSYERPHLHSYDRPHLHSYDRPHVHLNILRPRGSSGDSRSEGNKFQMMLNVKHFRPDEIDVKTVDNFVVIHGKHEEQADEHGLVSREFTRRYMLPDDVEPETVSSSLSQDGVLTIQAPRKQLEPPPKNERIVPIIIQQPAAVEEAQKQQQQIQDQAAAASETADTEN